MKSKKSTYKTIFYIVSISVLTFIIILLSINLFIYRNKNYLSYSENTNVDYKVNLKKNNYYQVDKLPSGMTYIANLIDNIESEINTQFIFYGIKENHTVEVFFSPITSEGNQTIFRIDNLQNTFISGEIIENNENNIIIDKFGNVFMNEFIEDSNNKISPAMSFYINEIKEGYNFGTN